MVHGAYRMHDRDNGGAPDEVSELAVPEYLQALESVFPGISSCGRLVVPSSSTRVLVDGQPEQSANVHIYFRAAPCDDPSMRWQMATLRAMISHHQGAPWDDPIPIAYAKPCNRKNGEVYRIAWPIFDPSVIGRQGLVFEGAPSISGAGLEVAPPCHELVDGPSFDENLIKDLSPKELREVTEAKSRISGKRLDINVEHETGPDGKKHVSSVEEVAHVLTLDFEVVSPSGPTTFGELIESGVDHARLQSPFRDSDSWAAFYSTKGGTPFIYDMGDRTKYVLDRESLRSTTAIIKAWLMATSRPSYVTLDGRIFCERENRPLRHGDVDLTSDLIKRLRMASNAPLLKGGGVDENRLPTHANKWLAVAWGDIKNGLPQGAAAEHAADVFKRQLLQMLNTMVPHNGRLHTIASLALNNAYLATVGETNPKKKHRWVQYEGYRIWARILADGAPDLAVQGGLSTQLSPQIKELAEMGNDEFTAKARAHGLAKGREVENRVFVQGEDQESEGNPARGRAAILILSKLEDLTLSISDDSPLAEALARILGAEPKTASVH
jgi:hypothetical protein